MGTSGIHSTPKTHPPKNGQTLEPGESLTIPAEGIVVQQWVSVPMIDALKVFGLLGETGRPNGVSGEPSDKFLGRSALPLVNSY